MTDAREARANPGYFWPTIGVLASLAVAFLGVLMFRNAVQYKDALVLNPEPIETTGYPRIGDPGAPVEICVYMKVSCPECLELIRSLVDLSDQNEGNLTVVLKPVASDAAYLHKCRSENEVRSALDDLYRGVMLPKSADRLVNLACAEASLLGIERVPVAFVNGFFAGGSIDTVVFMIELLAH